MQPPQYDIWVITQLADRLGQHPLLDIIVQSGIIHSLLGGFWYAAALFYFWVMGGKVRQMRVLTTLLGSGIAVALAFAFAKLISWPPPSRLPEVAPLYPNYILVSVNINSFPSDSMALYTAIAAGVWTLNRLAGTLLTIGLPLAIALPRMYVGGHYLSDIVAGFALGIVGWLISSRLLQPLLLRRECGFIQQNGWRSAVAEMIVFAWLWQVAVEFRELAFVSRALPQLFR